MSDSPGKSKENPRCRASVVCAESGKFLTVRAVDPVSGQNYDFLPGGQIELGESPQKAAIRETLEETGYAVTLVEGVEEVSEYVFFWKGQKMYCRTYFYLAKLMDTPREAVDDADYIFEVNWRALEKVKECFSYHEQIQASVLNLLRKLPENMS